MMLVSPSVASADPFHLEEETVFADRNFHQIHIDVEDGVAVPNITLGMNTCREICARWPTSYRSLHLSVFRPLDYLERVQNCYADIVFLQVSHLSEPDAILKEFHDAGIPLGIAISNRDFSHDWESLLTYAEQALVVTNYMGDPKRTFQQTMLETALHIAETYHMKTWIDGNVSYDIWRYLKDSPIYAAVMGGAVYRDKELAIRQFLSSEG